MSKNAGDENQITVETPLGKMRFCITGEEDGKEYAQLLSYEGKDMRLTIPSAAGSLPVRSVRAKAFFNNRFLQTLTIPSTVDTIGDWAFSHCISLSRVTMYQGPCSLGKGIFAQDTRLRCIALLPPGSDDTDAAAGEDAEGFGSLLAATCGILDAPFLLTTERKSDREWLALWDKRLMAILDSDDTEGLTELVLCGEEDYGSSENDPKEFLQKKRWRKVRLCFIRLLYDKMLADANKEKLRAYLLGHTKGCETEETWLFLKKERGDDIRCMQLFASLGCVNEQNFDACIADLSPDLPQLTAFLLRWQNENLAAKDFYGSLDL